MVEVRVLPSPVFISAMSPSCRAAPPKTWTSYGRSLRTRQAASRATAKASTCSSSRVAPSARRCRKTSVRPRSSSSDSASMSAARRLTSLTMRCRALALRPSPARRILSRTAGTVVVPYAGGGRRRSLPRPRGGAHPGTARWYGPSASRTRPGVHHRPGCTRRPGRSRRGALAGELLRRHDTLSGVDLCRVEPRLVDELGLQLADLTCELRLGAIDRGDRVGSGPARAQVLTLG